MHFSGTAVLVASVGLAAAQYGVTSTASSWSPAATAPGSNCNQALEALVNQCLKTEMPKVEGCASDDWICLCEGQEQVITCFHNCPSDSRSFGANQQKQSWCAAAKSYGSTSKVPKAAPKTATSTSIKAVSTGATVKGASKASDSNSGSTDGGNGAASVTTPLSGAIALFAGVLALL